MRGLDTEMVDKQPSFARRLSRRLEREMLLWTERLPPIELTALVAGDVQLEPLILDHACMPPYAGPPDHNDLVPLLTIARATMPALVVELGTAHGNSAANICRQCPQARVYTVNAPAEDQSGTLVTYELTRSEIGSVYRNYGYDSKVTQIFQNTLSLNLSSYLGGAQIDLAIIDACHDTDYVINDFFKVLPWIRTGGIVLLHDTHPSAPSQSTRRDPMTRHLIGSYVACLGLRRRGYDVRHLTGTWWAIWRNQE
jgi:predicted O-methyltransferase YrrM